MPITQKVKKVKKRKKQATAAVKQTTGLLSGALSKIQAMQRKRKKLLNQ